MVIWKPLPPPRTLAHTRNRLVVNVAGHTIVQRPDGQYEIDSPFGRVKGRMTRDPRKAFALLLATLEQTVDRELSTEMDYRLGNLLPKDGDDDG